MPSLNFDAERFASMVASKSCNQTLCLSGCNIDYCIGAYLMTKKHLSKEHRMKIGNLRNRLKVISPDIPTNKFNEEFNENLYYYFHEIPYNGKTLNYNTINGLVSTLRSILEWSGKFGAELTATFEDFPKEKEETATISLSRHEISHMYTYPLDKLPYRPQCLKVIERVRDEFILNCISYGLRYSDLSRLSESHFASGVLRINQKKTRHTLVNDGSLSFLLQIQREILAKYGSRDAIYSGDISNYNKHLKMLCQHLGGTFDDDIIISEEKVDGNMVVKKIKKWKKISSHVARHTFISINLSEGKPITEVSKTVGHASIKQTGDYAVHVEH